MFGAKTYDDYYITGMLISYGDDYYIQCMLGCTSHNHGDNISTDYGNRFIESAGYRVRPETIRQIMTLEEYLGK